MTGVYWTPVHSVLVCVTHQTTMAHTSASDERKAEIDPGPISFGILGEQRIEASALALSLQLARGIEAGWPRRRSALLLGGSVHESPVPRNAGRARQPLSSRQNREIQPP
jgi:hypothetical protein